MLNFRRGTTVGLSHDFVSFNVLGFISYAIFTFCGYFLPAVRAEYVSKTGLAPLIEIQDVLFAGHGAIMTIVLVYQVLFYPPGPAAKRWIAAPTIAALVGILASLGLALFGRISWIRYLETCGMIKVVTSIIKHFPQAYSNMKRRSTTGWSYTMVLLDVVGGGFSIAQQTVRCFILGSTAPFTANMSKTTLAAESLAFDFFFIFQVCDALAGGLGVPRLFTYRISRCCHYFPTDILLFCWLGSMPFCIPTGEMSRLRVYWALELRGKSLRGMVNTADCLAVGHN